MPFFSVVFASVRNADSANPSEVYFKAVKRMLRYLKGTKAYKLHLEGKDNFILNFLLPTRLNSWCRVQKPRTLVIIWPEIRWDALKYVGRRSKEFKLAKEKKRKEKKKKILGK